MSRLRPTLSPEVRALLDCERSVPPLSAADRARALTRARAALVAGVMRPSVPRAARWPRWAAVAAAACAASTAVGAAAYEIRAHLASHRPPASVVMVAAPPAPLGPPSPSTAELVGTNPVPAASTRTPTPSDGDTALAELRLLRQARAAVAREDFAAALPLIAEHSRRFKNGRLTEEREALRVKTLASLGRTEEARRAAAAFEARFPRSVLLHSVTQMPASDR